MQSTMRSLRRGNLKILFNPETDKTEHYKKSCRGVWIRGGERLSLQSVNSREEQYRKKLKEMLEAEKVKAKADALPKITG